MPTSRPIPALCLLLLALPLLPISAQPQALQTFTLREHFGVAHPDQIVDFPLNKPPAGEVHLVGPEGKDVPFQLLEGGRRLALRTDLPARAEKTWRLLPGKATLPPGDTVAVAELPTCYSLTNGLIGVRVTKPLEQVEPDASLPAPIQGVLLRDGTWTALGPNRLIYATASDYQKQTRPTGMKVEFLERGPLVVVMRVSYEFTVPDYMYGQTKTREAGPGSYSCTIRLEAGQPSLLFEEDTDIEPRWSLDFYEALHPTNARYRGHHAREAQYGYEPGGGTYRASHERRDLDAQVDLTYDRPRLSGYVSTPDLWRWMAVWDPWAFDSGWYWQMYDANAPAESNLIGIFAGRPSRALGAAFSGVGIYTLPAREENPPQAGIMFQSYRRSADARIFPRSRFQWGLFLGLKGQDLLDPTEVQPINRQMNLHGGVNLNKLQRLTLDFPDPPAGYGSMYMPKAAVEARVARLRAEPDYFRWCYNAEPMSRPLQDMWKDGTPAGVAKLMEQVSGEAQSLLDALVNRGGIYDFRYHYWHGGLAMSRLLPYIDQVLASDLASAEDKRVAKAAAVCFAGVLWDDDFVPLFTEHGLNLGTANMPVQQQNYREMYALYLATHPDFKERAAQVWANAQRMIKGTINEDGAHMGSSHYIGAANGPLLSTLQQLKMAGLADAFQTEPRLRKYAEFEMNFLTPPDPRFNNLRKRPAIGDAPPGEATEFWGQLGTAFSDLDPDLSARLMGAWEQSGKPHSGFHGSTLLKIDESLPVRDPALGSAHFPGWYSVLRSGWGTAHENAVWFVNGATYSDHAHNDLGEVVIFAHNAPLSLDFGNFYSPYAPGGILHSGVLPLAEVENAWQASPPPLDRGGRWAQPEQEQFQAQPTGGWSRTRFERGAISWTRAVSLAAPSPELAVFGIQDSFGGEEPNAPKVFSLNLMAAGAIETPQGPRAPGQTFTLPPGLHRLGCTGQTFEKHATGGIDWSLYVLAAQPMQGFVAEWSHRNVCPEQQLLLRLASDGPFRLVITAWPKGFAPADLQVQPAGDGPLADLTITAAGRTLRLAPSGALAP